MNTHDKKNGAVLTIVEAVETLSNIADLEFDRNVGVSQLHDLTLQGKPLTYHTVHWLHHKDSGDTVSVVRETFRVILHYLRDFYKQDYAHVYDPKAIEGIKTIMVLVGEAAKKLDKYTALFQKTQAKSVTDLKEYKKLQEFYLNRIEPKVDEGILGKWILALSQKVKSEKDIKLNGKTSPQTKHVFVDLESAKKDTEYELFYLKKEDGSRFFNPRLIRNIKLVSDFGTYFGEVKEEDLLSSMEIWRDRVAHAYGKNIVSSAQSYMKQYFSESKGAKEREIVILINKTLMAIMLTANPHNLSHNLPLKTCEDYFRDFIGYLRDCVASADYQHLIAYPPAKTDKLAVSIVEVIQALCLALYTQLTGDQELLSLIHGLIHSAQEQTKQDRSYSLANKLAMDYAAMAKLMKLHPNGPLNKILDSLEAGVYNGYDPASQGNLPTQLYSLYAQDHILKVLRWPCPTDQEFIHKANVKGEFKAFLRACDYDHEIKKCLLINLQDRTTWKEHFRCTAIEGLLEQDFHKHLAIVSLPKDTEFYHQLAPYHEDNNAEVFIKHLKEQVRGESGGFWFSGVLKKELGKTFINDVIEGIHKTFFSGKNVLLRDHRLDFIEIFYLFLQLKIMDLVKPDVVGVCCKDAIDNSSTTAAELFVFVKMLTQERLSENDQEHLDLMLYGPSLLYRERLVHPERFHRMNAAIKTIEGVCEQLGQKDFVKIIYEVFGKLYKTPILKAKAVVQKSRDAF